MPLTIEELPDIDDMDDSIIEAKDEFIASVSRGGLSKPSDYIYIASVHASSLYRFIFDNENLRNTLLGTQNPRKTFIESYMSMLENDEYTVKLMSIKCEKGHNHNKNLCRVAFTIFNISAKNYVSEVKDKLREFKKNKDKYKQSKSARKIKKLQSNWF